MNELISKEFIAMRDAAYVAERARKKCDAGCDKGRMIYTINGIDIPVPCSLAGLDCQWGKLLGKRIDSFALLSVKSIYGVPTRFQFDHIRESDAVFGVKLWNVKSSPILVFHGRHGSGKSYGAAYALITLCRNLNNANWQGETMRAISASWMSAYRATTKDDLFEEARIKPVLVLDDLGSEMPTTVARTKISEIISARYDHKRTTIITTNYDPDKIREIYGERMYDRIMDDGKFVACREESCRA